MNAEVDARRHYEEVRALARDWHDWPMLSLTIINGNVKVDRGPLPYNLRTELIRAAHALRKARSIPPVAT